MSNEKPKGDLVQYGAGWTKTGGDGNEYISGVVDRDLTVLLRNKDGETVEVDRLLVFFSNKTDKEGNVRENWPDVRLCANIKAD